MSVSFTPMTISQHAAQYEAEHSPAVISLFLCLSVCYTRKPCPNKLTYRIELIYLSDNARQGNYAIHCRIFRCGSRLLLSGC